MVRSKPISRWPQITPIRLSGIVTMTMTGSIQLRNWKLSRMRSLRARLTRPLA